MTLYEELELQPNCTFDEIKQQYRTLAKKHHPDLGGDEETFKRIKLAYEVLSDPVRRKQYDENKTTTVPIDNRKEAIDQLASIFFSIIPNFNCNAENLIEKMKTEVANLKNRVTADNMMNDIYIGNMELVKQKLKLKNPNDEDIIMSFIEQQLNHRYRDRETLAHRLEVLEIMLPILDKYDYGFLELIMPVELASEEPNQP